MAVPGIASTLLLNIILAWNEAFWTLNLTAAKAALAGLMSGLMLGMFIALLLLVISPAAPLATLVSVMLLGIGFSVLWSMIGYALKPGSESSLEVGGASYAMYTQGDGLWIKNAAEEERMVDAMRKAADVTVKGMSAKGTETTDTFSLKGLAQALDRLAQDCKR